VLFRDVGRYRGPDDAFLCLSEGVAIVYWLVRVLGHVLILPSVRARRGLVCHQVLCNRIDLSGDVPVKKQTIALVVLLAAGVGVAHAQTSQTKTQTPEESTKAFTGVVKSEGINKCALNDDACVADIGSMLLAAYNRTNFADFTTQIAAANLMLNVQKICEQTAQNTKDAGVKKRLTEDANGIQFAISHKRFPDS
jgi:hypothetical protein